MKQVPVRASSPVASTVTTRRYIGALASGACTRMVHPERRLQAEPPSRWKMRAGLLIHVHGQQPLSLRPAIETVRCWNGLGIFLWVVVWPLSSRLLQRMFILPGTKVAKYKRIFSIQLAQSAARSSCVGLLAPG